MKLKLILTTAIALLLAGGLLASAAPVQGAPFTYVVTARSHDVWQYAIGPGASSLR